MSGCFLRTMKMVSPNSGTLDRTNIRAQKPDTRSSSIKLKQMIWWGVNIYNVYDEIVKIIQLSEKVQIACWNKDSNKKPLLLLSEIFRRHNQIKFIAKLLPARKYFFFGLILRRLLFCFQNNNFLVVFLSWDI